MNLPEQTFSQFCLSLFKICSLLLLFSFPVSSQPQGSQSVISGTVSDKDSGKPLEDVHVYISYTTAGVSTDESGAFTFTAGLSGQFELVFSRVGYETEKRTITLGSDEESLVFNVQLVSKSIVLSQLEVKADNSAWLRNYEEFKREFLGTTFYATDTQITNRWVLDFNRNDSGQLVASASEPLRIENMSLGYELLVELDDFVWNLRDNTGYYRVQVRFEELEPESDREYRSWTQNRERAYKGSLRHFLKSLYDDNLSRNRFEVVWMNSTQRATIQPIEQNQMIQRLSSNGLNPKLALEGVKGFVLKEPVDILIGRRSYIHDNRKRARLVPVRNDKSFFVMPNGNVLDIMSLAVTGYWSSYRMADMVPIDFEPSRK